MLRERVKIGASLQSDGVCRFTVWAPFCEKVELKMAAPEEKLFPMEKDDRGYWKVLAKAVPPGALYFYRLDGKRDRPDPAAHHQPDGVHGCSQVVDHRAFVWEDASWGGIPLEDMVFYELHVGTFTPLGTFDAVTERLEDLDDLGINALNVMPVSQFPGTRNWGYDGVHPYAVQNSYGGPAGFKKLVNACHKNHMAVILDVVYNHLGPEGNYLHEFGPYFTDKYKTPWGKAVNLDDAYCDEVRSFFIQNALHWFENYHLDGLRLDAVHAIYDRSAQPFLRELKKEVAACAEKKGKKYFLIAESDLNDVKIIMPEEKGGYALDAQWCDDFHHSLHSLLTGEKTGYYVDFGETDHLARSIEEGFVLSGQYSAYRKRRHGISSRECPASQFIVFSQNHDQVGNRVKGDRLASLLPFEALKLAAGAVLLSPYIPLLFMGEEYAEQSPFLYFTSFADPDLIRTVMNGRKEEFKSFGWQEELPDPQNPETFSRTKLNWGNRKKGRGRIMLAFYRRLIQLRRTIPALSRPFKKNLEVDSWENEKVLLLHRWHDKSEAIILMNFNRQEVSIRIPLPDGKWSKVVDSSDRRWKEPQHSLNQYLTEARKKDISPLSLSVYQREELP